jgi:hypothetical protein
METSSAASKASRSAFFLATIGQPEMPTRLTLLGGFGGRNICFASCLGCSSGDNQNRNSPPCFHSSASLTSFALLAVSFFFS